MTYWGSNSVAGEVFQAGERGTGGCGVGEFFFLETLRLVMSKIFLVTNIVIARDEDVHAENGCEVIAAFTSREDAEKAKDIYAADGEIIAVSLDEMPEEMPPLQPGEKVWCVAVYANGDATAGVRPGRLVPFADFVHEVTGTTIWKGTCFNCCVVARTEKQAKAIGLKRRDAWQIANATGIA
jgi:hypothetical protein